MTTEKLSERKGRNHLSHPLLTIEGISTLLFMFPDATCSCEASIIPHVCYSYFSPRSGFYFILFFWGEWGRKVLSLSTSLTICCALWHLHDGMLPSRMLPVKDSPPREVILQGGVLMSMKKNPRYLGPWDQSLPHLCARSSNS